MFGENRESSGTVIINNLSTFSEVLKMKLLYILLFVRLLKTSSCLKLPLLLHT